MTTADKRRRLVIGTRSKIPWSPEFGRAVSDDLIAGLHEPWVTDPSADVDPVESQRFIKTISARARLPGGNPSRHRILLDWRSEEHLAGLSGLLKKEGNYAAPSGRDVTTDQAILMIRRSCVAIMARALRTPLATQIEQSNMITLMLSAIASCGMADPEVIACCIAPSPWARGDVRIVGSKAEGLLDPAVEAILPCGLSVSVDEQPDDGDNPIIRIDSWILSARTTELPGTVKTMRTLSTGWIHG